MSTQIFILFNIIQYEIQQMTLGWTTNIPSHHMRINAEMRGNIEI